MNVNEKLFLREREKIIFAVKHHISEIQEKLKQTLEYIDDTPEQGDYYALCHALTNYLPHCVALLIQELSNVNRAFFGNLYTANEFIK